MSAPDFSRHNDVGLQTESGHAATQSLRVSCSGSVGTRGVRVLRRLSVLPDVPPRSAVADVHDRRKYRGPSSWDRRRALVSAAVPEGSLYRQPTSSLHGYRSSSYSRRCVPATLARAGYQHLNRADAWQTNVSMCGQSPFSVSVPWPLRAQSRDRRFAHTDDVVLKIFDACNQRTAMQFLNEVRQRLPFRIQVLQTDNGAEFQSQFHWHAEGLDIRHVYIRPRTPQLNGKVERSHRVDDQEFYQLLDRDGVSDDIHLFNQKLREWEDYYNYHRPHGALEGQTPFERLIAKTRAGVSRRS